MKIKPLQIVAHIILIIGVLLMVLPIWISFASSTHENVSILTEGMRFTLGEQFSRNYNEVLNENINSSYFAPIDSFLELAPIDYDMDNSSRKELSSVSITEVDFPKVVYMIVDKKIELETKFLKDFPEWEFLPNDDLKRRTIEIFFDLNLAKRSCNKDQKVLKVPNTDVFKITAPLLIAKGISRIVCPDNLIAL